MKYLIRILYCALSLSLFCLQCAFAETSSQGEREMRIKAAIAYNIIKFVNWSEAPSTSLTVCLMASDPFAPHLENTIKGKTVNQRPLLLLRFKSPAQFSGNVKSCDIIFFSNPPAFDSSLIEEIVKDVNIISICVGGQLEWGRCMVQIFSSENRARIAVDSVWVSKSGHTLASELLDLAIRK